MITSFTGKPNTRLCTCCGQERPYPTEAGLWEYKCYWEEKWHQCEIKVCTGKERDANGMLLNDESIGQLLYYDETGEPEDLLIPRRWPEANSTMWRKIQ